MPDITLAQKLLWIHTGPFEEELIFGYHTGARNGGDLEDLLDIMVSWWQLVLTAAMKNRVTLTGVRALEWNDAQGKFVQVATREVSVAGGSVATIPPQCAVVCTYRYNDINVPQRQRYNRAYHGYISAASIESTDGRLTTAAQDALEDAVEILDTNLRLLPAQDTSLNGLCVVSVVGQVITPAEEIGVGRVVDTQRRRREDYPDDRTYRAIP